MEMAITPAHTGDVATVGTTAVRFSVGLEILPCRIEFERLRREATKKAQADITVG
jgi:hypothetical protein